MNAKKYVLNAKKYVYTSINMACIMLDDVFLFKSFLSLREYSDSLSFVGSCALLALGL